MEKEECVYLRLKKDSERELASIAEIMFGDGLIPKDYLESLCIIYRCADEELLNGKDAKILAYMVKALTDVQDLLEPEVYKSQEPGQAATDV